MMDGCHCSKQAVLEEPKGGEEEKRHGETQETGHTEKMGNEMCWPAFDGRRGSCYWRSIISVGIIIMGRPEVEWR